MKVTIIKHRVRYTEEREWPANSEAFKDMLAYHGYEALLYDRDDFQPHPLVSDIVVYKRNEPTHIGEVPYFWVTLVIGGDSHDILCWTVIDLFEVFEMVHLLPNV